jgi:CRP/FNR family cyclic AMP-dependent transcriptional regulator
MTWAAGRAAVGGLRMSDESLANVALFRDLEPETRALLAKSLEQRVFRKGETIVRENEPSTSLFIIQSGSVKISLGGEGGREVTLTVLQPGECFGEMGVIDGQPRSATATAVEDTTALCMTREQFRAQLQLHPEVAFELLAILSRRLRAADQQIDSLAFLDVQGRVARMLLKIADAEGEGTDDGILIPLEMTRRELANMVGTSRETLTRVLKDFERLGFIRLRKGGATLLNMARLRAKAT